MPQPPRQQSSTDGDFGASIQLILRQLDRLEERTRDLVTRPDIEELRKGLVTRDMLEIQLNVLRDYITRIEKEHSDDQTETMGRMDKMEAAQVTRQDRLWIRVGQLLSIAGFILATFELLSHFRFIP